MSLADFKGNTVLLVFWASWCLPSSAEVQSLDLVFQTYKDRGFRIIGINVDTLQGDHPKLDTVLPNIRRFLMDNNVRWPNLINGVGSNDYARAYGIVDIPSNVLIGRTESSRTLICRPAKISAKSSRKPCHRDGKTTWQAAAVPHHSLPSKRTRPEGLLVRREAFSG